MAKDREYELHLMLGSPSVVPWKWQAWQQIAQELAQVLASVNGKPVTYSRQRDRSAKRDVSFGRMTWSEQVHERWTHDSPKTMGKSDRWKFADTQVWVPSRTVCERERRRPAVYFQILNGALGGGAESIRFGSVVVLGVARDLPEAVKSKAGLAATNIGELIEAKLMAFKVRSWSRPFGPFAVADSLQDIDTWLFRVGPRHSEEPTLAMLHEEWELKPIPPRVLAKSW